MPATDGDALMLSDAKVILKLNGDALDYSTSGLHDATVLGAPTYTLMLANLGTALTSDSTGNDYLTLTPHADLDLPATDGVNGAGTVAFWWKNNNVVPGGGLGERYLQRWVSSTAKLIFTAHQTGDPDDGKLRFQFGNADTPISTIAITDTTTPHLIILERSASGVVKIFIDNVDATPGGVGSSTAAMSGWTSIHIGTHTAGDGYSQYGKMDQYTFYNRQLSAQEKTDYWNGGAGTEFAAASSTPKSVSGLITPTGVLSRSVARGLGGLISPSGNLFSTANKAAAGFITPSGDVSVSVQKGIAGSAAPAGSITKQSAADISGSITPSGTIAKQMSESVSGLITPTAAIDVSVQKNAAGAIAPSGSLDISVQKNVAGSITPTGSIAKQIDSELEGSIAPTGDVDGIITRFVVGSIVPFGDLSVSVQKNTAGSIAPTGDIQKSFAKNFFGSITPSGDLTVSYNHEESGLIAPTGTIDHTVIKYFPANITPAGELVRQITKRAAGSIVIASDRNLVINSAAGHVGSITPSGAVGKGYFQTLLGSLGPVGSVFKRASRFVGGLISPSGELDYSMNNHFVHGSITPSGALGPKTISSRKTGRATPTGALTTLLGSPAIGALAVNSSATTITITGVNAGVVIGAINLDGAPIAYTYAAPVITITIPAGVLGIHVLSATIGGVTRELPYIVYDEAVFNAPALIESILVSTTLPVVLTLTPATNPLTSLPYDATIIRIPAQATAYTAYFAELTLVSGYDLPFVESTAFIEAGPVGKVFAPEITIEAAITVPIPTNVERGRVSVQQYRGNQNWVEVPPSSITPTDINFTRGAI